MTQKQSSQFHQSELAVQERLGVAESVARYSEGFIRPEMPDQHRSFFSQLPFVLLGLVDHDGYPWAIPLFGNPGFIQSPSDQTLSLSHQPSLVKDIGLDFRVGQKIGVLGIALDTRRRNRLNGLIDHISDHGFSILVEQSFGNCPQYIQTRNLTFREHNDANLSQSQFDIADSIGHDAENKIQKADTFFIASRTAIFDSDPRSGIDVSHRGGKPGFVKVEGNRLVFPDFTGNRFFNTLGNIESDGRIGLFFPNFATGEAIFLVGKAKIIWEDESIASIEGAERLIEVGVERCLYIDEFLEMEGKLVEFSPFLAGTGVWP